MVVKIGLVAALAIGLMYAQSPDDPDIARAKTNIERLRDLVAAGAVPRLDLEKAEVALTEATETAFLRRTLYGSDLTEEQANEMAAVTLRRLERAQEALVHGQELVAEGVAPRTSLQELEDRLDLASKEQDYALSRAGLVRELAAMARAEADLHASLERAKSAQTPAVAERYDGDGVFTPYDLSRINSAFQSAFLKTMPVSAMGDTAVHRALGFDHRNRVDIALDPDAPEGVWLRKFLTANRIPYFAFRAAIQGKATGPHIHIGSMSNRLVNGG